MEPIRRFRMMAGGWEVEVRVFADGQVMVKYGGALLPLQSSSMPNAIRRAVTEKLRG